MFDETKKYKNWGHLFFKKGNKLSEVSKEVPELPGVYYIIRLARGRVGLVFIGKSGIIAHNGSFKGQTLRGRIKNKQEDITRQAFFDKKMIAETIDGLDIYWFVTMDKNHNDLPGYVEGMLMQRHFEVYGELPLWNMEY